MVRLHSSRSRGVLAVLSLFALLVCLGTVDVTSSFAVEPLEYEAATDDIIEGGKPGGDNESGDAEEIIIPNITSPQDPRSTDETDAQEPGLLEKIHDAFLAVTNWLMVR